ncbi:MliC family protein [Thiomonas sp. FB-Cd]|uniref:MliC family protein n=1 Tax=Thiomonas sp. FB-Cd TaxID=1158292 RepID=UPI001E4FA037|nr:MliC family protein [Thiomonas sp. FB-Cd]
MQTSQHPPSSGCQRLGTVFGTVALAALLAGCETAVPLNGPAPIVNIPMSAPPARVPPAPRNTYSPPPAPSAQPPAAEAQPLQPTPGIAVQPLAPESAPLPAPLAPSSQAAPPASGAMAPPAVSVYPPVPTAPAQQPMPSASGPQPSGPLPANAVRFVCNDGTSFIATFGDVSVTLSTALGVVRLDQTVAADGARYKNGDLQVWFKGRQATVTNLTQAGGSALCVEQR